jgi:hypothetical protein
MQLIGCLGIRLLASSVSDYPAICVASHAFLTGRGAFPLDGVQAASGESLSPVWLPSRVVPVRCMTQTP